MTTPAPLMPFTSSLGAPIARSAKPSPSKSLGTGGPPARALAEVRASMVATDDPTTSPDRRRFGP